MIDKTIDLIVSGVGHPAMVPALLVGIAILYSVVGIDSTNFAISVLTLGLLPVLLHSQSRDSAALQLKLDELIRATDAARNDLIGADRRTQAEIETLREEAP